MSHTVKGWTDICNSGVLPTRGDMTGDADYCNAG